MRHAVQSLHHVSSNAHLTGVQVINLCSPSLAKANHKFSCVDHCGGNETQRTKRRESASRCLTTHGRSRSAHNNSERTREQPVGGGKACRLRRAPIAPFERPNPQLERNPAAFLTSAATHGCLKHARSSGALRMVRRSPPTTGSEGWMRPCEAESTRPLWKANI